MIWFGEMFGWCVTPQVKFRAMINAVGRRQTLVTGEVLIANLLEEFCLFNSVKFDGFEYAIEFDSKPHRSF